MTDRRIEFERLIMPHMPAAYDLARWLMRHPQDAEDVVQDAFLKAFRSFSAEAVANPRAWVLTVVRNTAMTRLSRQPSLGKVVVLQDVLDGIEGGTGEALHDPAPRPDEWLLADDDRKLVHEALALLPQAFREALVLREFNDLSYQEISAIVGVPVGTVMSRLARGRERMRRILTGEDGTSGATPLRTKSND